MIEYLSLSVSIVCAVVAMDWIVNSERKDSESLDILSKWFGPISASDIRLVRIFRIVITLMYVTVAAALFSWL